MIQDRYKKEIIEIIRKYLGPCQIYLFGSRARGSNQPNSDIDIAIDTGARADWRTIVRIKQELDEQTTIPFKIDVVDLQSANESFKEEIIKDYILWTN